MGIRNFKFVPFKDVVSAAIIDTGADRGRMEIKYRHWAMRKLRSLYLGAMPQVPSRALLPVSKNTNTARLPIDTDEVTFVGSLVDGRKYPLHSDYQIVPDMAVEVDKCDKCGQNKNICKDLKYREERSEVIINGNPYEEVIEYEMRSDGSVYAHKTSPSLSMKDNTVSYIETTYFVSKIKTLPCGCPENTDENIEEIKKTDGTVYAAYYCDCDKTKVLDTGGYNILYEFGQIYLSPKYPYSNVYIEYNGLLKKQNGRYMVPEIAFETLVSHVVYMANEKNRSDRAYFYSKYQIAHEEMINNMFNLSLADIVDAFNEVPQSTIKLRGEIG